MKLERPQTGYTYIRYKDTGAISLVPKFMVKTEFHEVIDFDNPEPAKVEKSEVPVDDTDKVKAELSEMSLFKLKQLPAFETLKDKNFKNKEDLIVALLEVMDKEKVKDEEVKE